MAGEKLNTFESQEKLYPEKVYISVHNLVRRIRVRETDEVFYLAMQGKPITLDGVERKRFQAIGGAVKVTEQLRKKLKDKLGAQFGTTGSAEENDDARFHLPIPEELRAMDDATSQKRVAYIWSVINKFSDISSKEFETSVQREMHEDFVGKGIISESDFAGVTSRYVGGVTPIQFSYSTSARGGAAPSHRLFHLHDIEVSEEVFNKISSNSKIKILSEDDVARRARASATGQPASILADGSVLVENIVPDVI